MGEFYNGDLWGFFLIFCQIQLKFHFLPHKKIWHISCKFQLGKRNDKNVITKKPLTNLFEMNSKTILRTIWKILAAATVTHLQKMIFLHSAQFKNSEWIKAYGKGWSRKTLFVSPISGFPSWRRLHKPSYSEFHKGLNNCHTCIIGLGSGLVLSFFFN